MPFASHRWINTLDRWSSTAVSQQALILSVAGFLLIFANQAFFRNVLEVYPLGLSHGLFLLSVVVVFAALNVIVLSLFCFRYTIKPVLILLLLISSQSAYFMDSYNVIVDDTMIDNIVKTNVNEAMDLTSLRQLLYFILLGAVPSLLIYKVRLQDMTMKSSLVANLKLFGLALLLLIAVIVPFSSHYASFFREHKQLRSYSNPSYYIYSSIEYMKKVLTAGHRALRHVGEDAKVPASDNHRELVIFVVGETARADRFSLNGYGRKTNPYLEKEKVLSFTNVWSCGTSTFVSVPCMFSIYGQGNYDETNGLYTENALDVIKRAGANVIWLDNNSDSFGVADRVEYIDYKNTEHNTACDVECRDEGMLDNLQGYIDSHPTGDIFVVLHQMGNHGPAYYKRYPERFANFKPVCATNQLEECTPEEINNAYDNAILYTDYFLHRVIGLLERNSQQSGFEAVMFYASDHGESLGENSLYLHGMPYMLAPDVQKHVPLIMWFSENMRYDDVDYEATRARVNERFSHDNLFHSILGMLEIDSDVYDIKMDMIEYDRHYLETEFKGG